MLRTRRALVACVFVLWTAAVGQTARKAPTKAANTVPTPASVFGFEPGADYHLADYEQITKYFQQLAAAVPQRVKLEQIGKTGYGREMFVAIISSEENMRALDRYKQMVKQLASGEIDDATARRLADEGKRLSGLMVACMRPKLPERSSLR